MDRRQIEEKLLERYDELGTVTKMEQRRELFRRVIEMTPTEGLETLLIVEVRS